MNYTSNFYVLQSTMDNISVNMVYNNNSNVIDVKKREGLMITLSIFTAFFNILLISIILTSRKLRNQVMYINRFLLHSSMSFLMQRLCNVILSLAVTDLLCGLLVMPFPIFRYRFFRVIPRISLSWTFRWTLGKTMCQFYTSMEVILLSSSIYNFVCMNIDRLAEL